MKDPFIRNTESSFLLCSECTWPYESKGVRLVERGEEHDIFFVQCSRCHNAMLIGIREVDESLECAGIVTDCRWEDVKRFWRSPKISLDDVIDAHKALQLDNFMKIG